MATQSERIAMLIESLSGGPIMLEIYATGPDDGGPDDGELRAMLEASASAYAAQASNIRCRGTKSPAARQKARAEERAKLYARAAATLAGRVTRDPGRKTVVRLSGD